MDRVLAARTGLVALGLLLPCVATAQSSAPAASRISLTVTPFEIVPALAQQASVFPVELTGEFRVTAKASAGFVAGVGRQTENISGLDRVSVGYDLGLEARYYLLGGFPRGISLGWELYGFDVVKVAADSYGTSVGSEVGGLTTGPIAHFKYAWPVGFTIDGQLGYGRIVYTRGYTFDASAYGPRLGLKAGWTF